MLTSLVHSRIYIYIYIYMRERERETVLVAKLEFDFSDKWWNLYLKALITGAYLSGSL